MRNDNAKVIIASSIVPPPEAHEISAAWILAKHYKCTIEFIKPIDGYKLKTPDFVMNSLEGELKSPIGRSKRTIRDKLSAAKTQSPNIVIDARRTKLTDSYIESEMRRQCVIKKSIHRLILIAKNAAVIEIRK